MSEIILSFLIGEKIDLAGALFRVYFYFLVQKIVLPQNLYFDLTLVDIKALVDAMNLFYFFPKCYIFYDLS